MPESYFTLDTKSVIFERFDDELIAIHLDRGNYFSLNSTAGAIFELAAMQPTASEIVTALTQRYEGGTAEIEAEVARFMSELQAEGLIGTSVSR
ncbi:MAG: PqqD family protein, partial [Bryobacteraceae bacterium]